MKKPLIIIAILLTILVLFSIRKNRTIAFNPDKPTDLILFWGQGCPHCQKVEDHILTNGIDKKLNIDSREIYNNKANQTLFYQTIQQCPELASNPDNVGVPLAYDNGTCLSGDQPIIDYLAKKLSSHQ